MKERVIQKHHIVYGSPEHKSQSDEIVNIYKGEHMVLTRIQWMKTYSKGFIKSLKVFLALNEDKAIDLEFK